MENEYKELLLRDICSRLPYGLIVQYKQKSFCPQGEYTVDVKIEIDDMLHHRLKLLDFKPYLRPMSSMTEEERNWYKTLLNGNIGESIIKSIDNTINWLNANHFDYHGLIPMGLALEATKDMYNKI